MLAPVEMDELADPVDVGLLGSRGLMEPSHRVVDGFEEGHRGSPWLREHKVRPSARGMSIGGGDELRDVCRIFFRVDAGDRHVDAAAVLA